MTHLGVPPAPAVPFDEAARQVVGYLRGHLGLDAVALVRCESTGTRVVLHCDDPVYGMSQGSVLVPAGGASAVAPASRTVDDTRAGRAAFLAPVGPDVPVLAYLSVPVPGPPGGPPHELVGLGQVIAVTPLAAWLPLVEVMASLLGAVLHATDAQAEAEHRAGAAMTLAETDGLTGLANRRGWDRILRVEEKRHARFGNEPGGIVAIDLDRLKKVNDHLGHEAGDEYLRAAAGALRDALRETDHAARVGGDEFAVIARTTDPSGMQTLADRIAAFLDQAGVEASVGWAPRDPTGGFHDAWRIADERMYEQKRTRAGKASDAYPVAVRGVVAEQQG